ncbi:MAG TPA: hypothetical protein VHD32_12720 [Candidatus Didemnitutus sp.]|nr:hypothetical protein [Candidatus Didemnitutus sp.]
MNSQREKPRTHFLRLGPWAAAAWFAVIVAGPVHAADAEPKTHALFLGADIAVMEQKELRPVEDVQGGAFVVKVDGKEMKVQAGWGNVAMKVERAVKISATAVSLGKLKFERAYTPGNDPAKIFAREQGEEQSVLYEWEQTANMLAAQNAMGKPAPAPPTPGKGSTSNVAPNFYSMQHEDGFALDHHLQEMSGRMFSLGTHQASLVGAMQEQLAEGLYDAIDVECDLTSPVPLRKPYVVLLARFHAKDATPDHGQNWLYAAELDHLDQKPERIRIRKGGFPPGYILDSYQIHVYDGLHEVATDASEDRVALTQSEAYKYLRADYLASHKGATSRAVAVMGRLSEAEKQKIGASLYGQTFYVKVAADGTPGGTFADAGLSQPVFDAIAQLAARARFLPALTNGKPVEGVAELRFSQLHL